MAKPITTGATADIVKRYTALPKAKSLNPEHVQYLEYVEEASMRYDIDAGLILAVIQSESDFDQYAISESAGALGLMQLLIGTAQEYGAGDAFDPKENIMAGTAFLATLIDRYQGDISLALAAYNAGPTKVEKFGGVPPYKETVNFIKRVSSFRGLDFTRPITGPEIISRYEQPEETFISKNVQGNESNFVWTRKLKLEDSHTELTKDLNKSKTPIEAMPINTPPKKKR